MRSKSIEQAQDHKGKRESIMEQQAPTIIALLGWFAS